MRKSLALTIVGASTKFEQRILQAYAIRIMRVELGT
jgi:hypothetical protein